MAQRSLAHGIAAEQQGTNIEALTYYIQARKNSRNLSEATKDCSYIVTYAEQYGHWDITTGLKVNGITPLGYLFKTTVGDADTDALYVSIENKGKKEVSIMPVPEGTVSTLYAMEVIATGKHNGTLKVGGYFGSWTEDIFYKAMNVGEKPISLDLSELQFDSGSKA